jgi:fumarate hydratase subunit alpha
MKAIDEAIFKEKFREQLIHANFQLREDVRVYFKNLRERVSQKQQKIVDIFIENSEIAFREKRALCQDTGYVQVFVRIGNRARIDFDLEKAINLSVKEVYQDCGLRKSLAYPLSRQNTSGNTPAFIDYEFCEGENLEVFIMLKGGGSENATKAELLLPTASLEEIESWVVKMVEKIGARACPPYLISVGIGGNLGKALYYSKKMLLEGIDEGGMDEEEKSLSENLLKKINALPIGFQGLQFGETAMSVKVRMIPCHIATLPIALSIGCNSVRQGRFIF